MYRAGVTCSDCHDPHSARLRASRQCAVRPVPPGRRLTTGRSTTITRRARPARSACPATCSSAPTWSSTAAATTASACRARISPSGWARRTPAPTATPTRSARWAADAVRELVRHARHGPGTTARRSPPGAPRASTRRRELLRAIDDPAVPAIARATAVTLLPLYARAALARCRAARRSGPDPARAPRRGREPDSRSTPARASSSASPLLGDPVRTVRLEALGSLLDVPRAASPAPSSRSLDGAIAEYRQVQELQRRSRRGARQPRHAGDATRQRHGGAAGVRDGDAAAAVVHARLRRPGRPAAPPGARGRRRSDPAPRRADRTRTTPPSTQALGLSLVRQQRVREALPELARAAQLAPDVPRYAYVYAIALHDSGDVRRGDRRADAGPRAPSRRARDRRRPDRVRIGARQRCRCHRVDAPAPSIGGGP